MGRVVHFEIPADDLERCANFYRNVFDWEIKKWDGPFEYWMVMTGTQNSEMVGKEGQGIDGGLMKRMGPVTPAHPNAFVCTIDTEDIDADIAKVLANGGEIALPKNEIPQVGLLAYCKDTEGNIFGLMQDLSRSSL